MSADPVPDDVKRFILDYIDSIPALEALLLMRRQPERRWTAAAMAAALYTEPRRVAALLADLDTRGLCAQRPDHEPTYGWPPATDDLRRLVDRLADTYAKHLVAVTNIVHGKPRASVRSFSDAFRLRGSE